MTRLEAPRWFQHLTAALIVLLFGAASCLLYATARVIHHFQPSVPPEGRWLLEALWLLALVSVASLIPIAIYLYRLSRTVLEYDASGVYLHRPAGEWRGSWNGLRRVYVLGEFLAIQTREERWRTWHVRLSGAGTETIWQTFRKQLPPGVWLDEAQTRQHLLKQSVPILLGVALLGVLLLYAINRARESWLPRD